jgi:hypothetical protein
MKISLIIWSLFWALFINRNLAGLDKWLGRWVLADDGVRLSMKTQPLKTVTSDVVVEHVETAGISLSLQRRRR